VAGVKRQEMHTKFDGGNPLECKGFDDLLYRRITLDG
jgi:hypothetical protein